MILDDATKEPPADPDAVFVPELPYGSNRVCQYRLVERTFLGPHSSPIERLLLPEGDPTLLGQAPARPDRMHAAHGALLASTAPEARTLGPQAQLASVYLAAHTDRATGNGLEELDQMARSCDIRHAELARTLDQLTATALLETWQASPYSGDLYWTLARTHRNAPCIAGEQ
ncbi:hypothetical protein ACFXA0_20650 [Streptomyces cyaneofuscatus]|uniref:hypothetical protein n=1 Tax=Streptomyces cyaneofuscatus TaxID=66883 RepID=UPI0036C1E34C